MRWWGAAGQREFEQGDEKYMTQGSRAKASKLARHGLKSYVTLSKERRIFLNGPREYVNGDTYSGLAV